MSKLAAVKRGKLKEPARICVAAAEGVGKTTLAAGAPDPIFLDIEGGSGQVDVARYPFRPDDEKRGHIPDNYGEVKDAVSDLLTSPHDYQTLVVDTADALEKLIHKFVVDRDKPKSKEGLPGINAFPYGKGFDISLDELRTFLQSMDRLRTERGMSIVFLSHIVVKRFESPTSAPYDRYTMRTNEKFAGCLREWCDIVGFGCFEETTTELISDRVKGVATGRRLLKFKRDATYDAKSRYAIPDQVEMTIVNPWAPFAKVLSDAQDMGVEQIAAAIMVECERVGDDLTTAKAKEYIKTADIPTLQRVLEKLKEKEGSKK
jgi:hypothetical protein